MSYIKGILFYLKNIINNRNIAWLIYLCTTLSFSSFFQSMTVIIPNFEESGTSIML